MDLDNDSGGEDADFTIRDGSANTLFNVDEDNSVTMGPVASKHMTLTGPDDSKLGPILTLAGESTDQFETSRIRFVEGSPASNWRGGYLHYDGATNKMHIGVHDADDQSLANDEDVITIERASGQVGIGTKTPNRELTVNDTDGSSDAVVNITAPGRELLVGVNQCTGGLIAMQTANALRFRTSAAARMTIRDDGTVDVEQAIRKDFGSAEYTSVVPLAMGRYDSSTDTVIVGTANVSASVGTGPTGDFVVLNIDGRAPPDAPDCNTLPVCPYIIQATPTGNVTLFARTGCSSDGAPFFRIDQVSFGVNVVNDFSFVVHKFQTRTET